MNLIAVFCKMRKLTLFVLLRTLPTILHHIVGKVCDKTNACASATLYSYIEYMADWFQNSFYFTQVMGIWDQYPIGASWYTWRSGYVWETVENKMTRPSPDDDVFIISNTFSKTRMQGWLEGALQIVDRTFAQFFPAI